MGPLHLLDLGTGDLPGCVLVAMRQTPDGPVFAGCGRGLTREAAAASAVGEAVERAVAERLLPRAADGAAWGRLPTVSANSVWHFSAGQRAHGPHPSEGFKPEHWARVLATLRRPRRWQPARRRDGTITHRVPAAVVSLGDNSGPGDSNGLAAHTTRAAAERSAVLELVERDAAAVWWYNRCPRPPLPLDLLGEAGTSRVLAWARERPRRTHLLDLTHDLRVPVAAAISAEPDGSGIAYACAAASSLAAAALSATLELMQAELTLRLAAERAALVGQPEGPAGRLLVWSRAHALADLPHLRPHDGAPRVAPEPPDADTIAVVERYGPHPVLFVDLDTPDDPLRVVRAIVPGLRGWMPRFAPGRLFSVPRALGWPHTPIVEAAVGPDDAILI